MMDRRFFAKLLLGLVLIIASVLTYSKIRNKDARLTQVGQAITKIVGSDIRGNRFHLQQALASTRAFVVFFDPSCDHCDYEANQIKKNVGKFYRCKIIMISTADMAKIYDFRKLHELTEPNIQFVHVTLENAYNSFGSLRVPQVYLYNEQGVVQYSVQGEADINKVLLYL